MAQKELEKFTDITFEYELSKTGKRFTDIVFHIKQKPIPEDVKIQTAPTEGAKRIIERLTTDFRLRHDQAIIAQFSTQDINRTMTSILK